LKISLILDEFQNAGHNLGITMKHEVENS